MTEATTTQAPSQQDQDFIATMASLLKGESKPQDDHIAYLLESYRADTQALVHAQESVVKMRGRIESREADMRHWYDKNASKGTGEESSPVEPPAS